MAQEATCLLLLLFDMPKGSVIPWVFFVTSPNIEEALTAFVSDKDVIADVNIFGDYFVCFRLQMLCTLIFI